MKKIFSVVYMLCIATAVMAQLTISLKADKSTYVIGEPVVVYATVTNTGNQDVKVSTLFAPEYNDYFYSIQKPDKIIARFAPLTVKDGYDPAPVIGKNRSVSGSARIYYGANGYSFKTPGAYLITCTTGDVKTVPLSISFKEPNTDAEKAFAEGILNNDEVGMVMMMESGDKFATGINHLESIIQKYPETPYASIAAYTLGRLFSRGSMNFVTKKPRAPDFTKANTYFEKVKPEAIGAYYMSQTYTFLAEINKKQQKTEAALEIEKQIPEKLKKLGPAGALMLDEYNRRVEIRDRK